MSPPNKALAALWLGACATQPHWPADTPPDRCAAALPEGPLVLDVSVDGRTRRALVWVPQSPGPHDVVINLHEFRAEPERQAWYSGWYPYFREVNAILVAPDGRSATWNVGTCCGMSQVRGTDDVAFLDAIVARLDETACTSGRVLATGIGNGGMLAEHWACHSDVPDAVVSVGGALQVERCPVLRPIPLLHFHGADDRFLPADGSAGPVATRLLPVAQAMEVWAARNHARRQPDLVEGDLTCAVWEGAASVTSCTVAGMADAWPGAAGTTARGPFEQPAATRGAWSWVNARWRRDP